jgi:hypothetical protein
MGERGILKNNFNRLTEKTNLWLPKEKGGRDKLIVWN